MRYKILSNKRAIAIEDAVAMIIFLFVAAFGIFFFNINENVKGKILATDIQEQKEKLFGHEVLATYAESAGNKVAAKAFIDKNFELLRNDMSQYFEEKLAGNRWHIDVKDSSNSIIFSMESQSLYPSSEGNIEGAPYLIDSIAMPISGEDYISIDLFLIK